MSAKPKCKICIYFIERLRLYMVRTTNVIAEEYSAKAPVADDDVHVTHCSNVFSLLDFHWGTGIWQLIFTYTTQEPASNALHKTARRLNFTTQ